MKLHGYWRSTAAWRVRLALHLFYLEPDPVDAAKKALGISRAQFYRLVAEARQLIAAQLTREDLQS